MAHIKPLLTAALFLAAAASAGAQSVSAPDLPSLEEFDVDLSAFEGSFGIAMVTENVLRLMTADGRSGPALNVSLLGGLSSFTPDADAFGSPEHLRYTQASCDRSFGGTCEMSSIGTPQAPTIAVRVQRDDDNAIYLETRHLVGDTVIYITAFGGTEMPEDSVQATLSEMTEQVFEHFDLP